MKSLAIVVMIFAFTPKASYPPRLRNGCTDKKNFVGWIRLAGLREGESIMDYFGVGQR